MTDEEIRQTFAQMAAGMQQVAASMAESMKRVTDTLRDAADTLAASFTAYVRGCYEGAGAPYGPDDAAMWRWWQEIFRQ
jgi:murein endopeptidase